MQNLVHVIEKYWKQLNKREQHLVNVKQYGQLQYQSIPGGRAHLPKVQEIKNTINLNSFSHQTVTLSIESFLAAFTQPFYSSSQLFCESTYLRVVSKVSTWFKKWIISLRWIFLVISLGCCPKTYLGAYFGKFKKESILCKHAVLLSVEDCLKSKTGQVWVKFSIFNR